MTRNSDGIILVAEYNLLEQVFGCKDWGNIMELKMNNIKEKLGLLRIIISKRAFMVFRMCFEEVAFRIHYARQTGLARHRTTEETTNVFRLSAGPTRRLRLPEGSTWVIHSFIFP